MLTNLRQWLIKRLAGDMPVALNLTVRGRLEIPDGPQLVANCKARRMRDSGASSARVTRVC